MSTLVYYDSEPEVIKYMSISSTQADVWLRQNIEEYTTDENTTAWKADEVYFRTYYDEDYVTENFDTLWEGSEEDTLGTDDSGVVNNTVSVETRIAALEAANLELAELVAELIATEEDADG